MIEVGRRLTLEEQIELLDACRVVVRQAPLFQKTMPTGANFRYLCTSAGDYGWMSDRKGYRYEELHPLTHSAFPPMPEIIQRIAIETAAQYTLSLRPESALINWYGEDGTLGLHQDKTEKCLSPVISISLGDDCIFTIGGLKRADKKHDLTLHSGDVLIMAEEHRLVFHGVKRILPGTAPAELKLQQGGRINVTVRQVFS
ncbi:MAG: alpha-ketoglutarate-dependent dioxygenase AlkB [Chloroflexota bacterium]